MKKMRKKKTTVIITGREVKGITMKTIEMRWKEVVKKDQKESITTKEGTTTKGEIEGGMSTTKDDINEFKYLFANFTNF